MMDRVHDGGRDLRKRDALYTVVVTPLYPPFKEPVKDFLIKDETEVIHLSLPDARRLSNILKLVRPGRHKVAIHCPDDDPTIVIKVYR